MAKRPSLKRIFDKPFVLSGSKLAKINEIAEKRLGMIKGERNIEKTFTVTLEKGRKHVFTKIDSVLELDNSIANKIIEISAEWEVGKDEDKYEGIFLNYDSDISTLFDSTSIIIAGKAEEATWLNETISEIEEQVERTIQRDIVYLFRALPNYRVFLLSLAVILVLVGSFSILQIAETGTNRLGLTIEENQQMIDLKEKVVTSEDKINFIYSILAASLKENENNQLYLLLLKPSTYFIMSPIVVILITFYYLLSHCYPIYVFELGDYGEHYRKIVERRKYLWSLIIGSLLIGIIANLFVFGVSESVLSK